MDFIVENNIIKSKDLIFDENVGGIGMVLFEHMKKHGTHISQVEAENGNCDTFASLLEKCKRTAIALKERGIEKGDFVCLSSDHHLNACVPIVAAIFLGAVPFSLEPSLSIPDCSELLKQIQPKIVFVRKFCEANFKESCKLAGVLVDIVVFEDSFEDEFLKSKSTESFNPVYIQDLKETAIIYFSSGTTGLPKPVCINHYSLTAASSGGISLVPGKKSGHEVMLSFSNWYWVSSGWILVCCTVERVCRLLTNHFDPYRVWHYIDQYKVTSMFLSPLKIIELCGVDRPKEVNISSLKYINFGGSTLPLEYIVKLRNVFPSALVLQGYGQTEAGVLSKFSDIDNKRILKFIDEKPTTMGMPLRGIWYKVVDPKTGKSLGCNQPGELLVKTQMMMNGYYNRDSSSCFDEDGYFKTGDLVYYDEDYCFYFVQRIKELLKYREWHVFPAMLESILLKHPAVKNAVVIGKPHKVDGDHPSGVVILKENCRVTEDELLKFVNNLVEERQRLRGGIKFVQTFPFGATGKIDRNAIKKIMLKDLMCN